MLDADHTPRVTIDRLVIKRESWRFLASSIPFAFSKNEQAAFVEARRWARANGLPRFLFVKSPLEPKPVFLDFEGPMSLRIVGKIIRHANDEGKDLKLAFSEMLPDLEQVWLPDSEGNRYTCELRLAASDLRYDDFDAPNESGSS